MLYKNNIIELFDNDVKEILYQALQSNKIIMYTRNLRSTPLRNKEGIDNVYIAENNNKTYTVTIEPSKTQLEYFDYNIIDIRTSIEKDIKIQDLKKYLKKNNKDKFIDTLVKSNFNFLSQYDVNVVYEYINNIEI